MGVAVMAEEVSGTGKFVHIGVLGEQSFWLLRFSCLENNIEDKEYLLYGIVLRKHLINIKICDRYRVALPERCKMAQVVTLFVPGGLTGCLRYFILLDRIYTSKNGDLPIFQRVVARKI